MSEPLPPQHRGVTVALTTVAYLMVTLDALVVITALPSIHEDLGGDVASLQWTVNAYTLAFASGIVTAAALGDRLGRRRVYTAGLALFTLASAACALAPGLGSLIAFRGVQGLGAAVIMPLGMTLLTSAFPLERRGQAVGLWGGVAGLGVAAGPLVGGSITEGLDWHWVFWVNVPIGIAAIVGARLALRESYGPRSRLDVPGMALVAGGVATLVWGLVRGPEVGWDSTGVVVALVAAGLLLVGFVVREATAPEPMIPLRFFRIPTFASAVVAMFCMSGGIFSAAFLTAQYFQVGRGNSPLETGIHLLPWTMTPLFVAPVAGLLFDRVGGRRLAVPGLLMQVIGFGWIIHEVGAGAGYPSLIAPFVLAGVGVSMALPSVPSSGLNSVPPAALGKATGVLNTLQQLGAAVGVALVTVAFDANGSLGSATDATEGYRAALGVSLALTAFAALAALGLRRAVPLPVAEPVDVVEPAAFTSGAH